MIAWSEEHNAALRAYLGADRAGRYDDAELQRVWEVEASAQARMCRVGDPVAPELVEALYRRVSRSLALRAYPTGLDQLASDGGVTAVRVGGRDPEVARLEAPFRRLVAF